MGRVERTWEQVEGALTLDLALKIGEDDRHVVTEFPNDLTTCAAGRRERVRVGDDGDSVEFVRTFSFGERLEDGDAFSAESEAVAGIFDVATGEDATGFAAHSGTHAKFGEWSMSVLAGGASRGD
ncbi:MAG TPA: hypothetical protein VKB26_07025 [Candidatus Acidoferrales bacterium]|nr:hypothetical protein [Candidatus Acidoferrales bacterium]